MAVRTIKKSWWVDLRFNYTRYRLRSPENSKAGAQAYEAQLRHKLACGEEIGGRPQENPQELSFEQFSGRWFDEYVIPNNKHSERKAKRYILSGSLVPFFGKIPIGQISTQHVEQYKASQCKVGVGNKTINNRLTVLNKCLLTAYEWLEIETAPPKIKKLKCAPVQTDYLSQEESAHLLSQASGTLYELLLTTVRTGMRQGELKALQWESINWQNRTIAVRHSWNDEMRVLEAPKNNRERIIPLSSEVYEALFKRKRRAGFVFTGENGKPFSEKLLNPRLAAVCKRAGIRRITWHTLRHTFATHLMMLGAAPNTVQTLLGHASITTTMRYAHVPSSSLREAVNLLDPKFASVGNFGQPVGNQGMRFVNDTAPFERLVLENL